MAKHDNKKFKRCIKGELIKAGFIITKTKMGHKLLKNINNKPKVYFIHETGGSKCFKRLKRILRRDFNYNLKAKI